MSILSVLQKFSQRNKEQGKIFKNIIRKTYLVNAESEINTIVASQKIAYQWTIPTNISLNQARSIIESDEDFLNDSMADAAHSFSFAKILENYIFNFTNVAQREIIRALALSIFLFFGLITLLLLVTISTASVICSAFVLLSCLGSLYSVIINTYFYGNILEMYHMIFMDTCKKAAVATINYELNSSAADLRHKLLFEKFGDKLYSDVEED